MMTAVADTLLGLGTPSEDGAVGFLETDGFREMLVWNSDQQCWVGRPKPSMRMLDGFGMRQAGDNSLWTYPSTGDNDFDKNWGFQIHQVHNSELFWNAGLRIQECLVGAIRPNDGGSTPPQIALNWYSLENGDSFLTPAPTNIGVTLDGEAAADPANYHPYCSGWQNSPISAPTAKNSYPELYVKGGVGSGGGFAFSNFYALHRWVGGTVGGLGGSDDSRDRPPVSEKLYSWNSAENIGRENGAAVDNWPDYSGWQRHLVQATGTNQPTLVRNGLNGLAYVSFSTNDFMKSLAGAYTGSVRIFMVMRQRNTGGATQVWLSGGSSAPLFYRADNNGNVNYWGGSGSDMTYDTGSWPTPWTAFEVIQDGANSAMRENKVQKVAVSHAATSFNGITVGCRGSDNTLFADIDVAEILIYYGTLTGGEANSVVDWLNSKYALF